MKKRIKSLLDKAVSQMLSKNKNWQKIRAVKNDKVFIKAISSRNGNEENKITNGDTIEKNMEIKEENYLLQNKNNSSKTPKKEGKRYSNGYNIQATLVGFYSIPQDYILVFHSRDTKNNELFKKAHRVNDISIHTGLNAEGNVLINPRFNGEFLDVNVLPEFVAHLITGLQEIIAPRKSIYYFPAYEIMMDELRDYRFYKEDMIHPNQIAINYIWEKFYENWLSDEAIDLKKQVIKIQRGLEHKPFNPDSKKHQQFLLSLQEKIEILKKKYSHISF